MSILPRRAPSRKGIPTMADIAPPNAPPLPAGEGLTQGLADYILGVRYEALPAEVRSKCLELLLDALACGLAGSRTPLGQTVRELARAMGGCPQASLWGTEAKSSCTWAAYHNASVINALDYDDTAEIGHPGATVIPVIWALAEWKDLDGGALIEAMVTGYETSIRTAAAVLPSVARYSQIHGIGTPQTLGAAAAAARLLGLNREQTLNALGIAGANAPVAHAGKFGWTDKSISYIKDNVAVPAEIGLRAAVLAEQGYQGSESILDGETGFWVMAGSDRFDYPQLMDFSEYRILNVSLKPYPCCRWIHTTLDVCRDLRRQGPFEARDIHRVDVFSLPVLAKQFQRKVPHNFIDLQFSVPLSLSLAICNVPWAQWWRKENHLRQEVLDTAARIEVHSQDDYQVRFEDLGRRSACIPTRLEITLKNGRKLEGYAEEARGLPSKPLSPAERLEKFNHLTEGLLAPDPRDRLRKDIQNLDRLSRIPRISELMAPTL